MNAEFFSFIFKCKSPHLGPRAKIQQESDFYFCRAQIVKQLGFMGRIKRFAGFEFKQHHAFDYQIGIIGTNFLAVKPYRNGGLLLKSNSTFFQNQGHCLFVNFLKKPCAQLVVDLVKNANNLFGQFRVFISALLCVHLRQMHHHATPRHIARMAILTYTPLCTCSSMTDWGPSATSLWISMPRIMGPGCITMASLLASFSRSGVSW